jgi:hypothetical protein
MIRSALMVIFLLAGTVAQDAAAQRRRAGGSPGTETEGNTPVSIIARVGTQSYTSRVPGTCQHEPVASIYNVPAALWTVRATGSDNEVKQLTLTLWRPKNGSADQVSISLEAGSASSRIDVNPRTPPVGTATVEVKQVGPGGKFEVRGKDAKGAKLYLTISCPTFTGVEAAGG